MSKQIDTRKRLMVMLQNDISLQQQENALAKQSTKFHNKMAGRQQTIKRQQRKLDKLNEMSNLRQDDEENRIAFEQAMRDKLSREQQNLIEMQKELATKKQQRDDMIGFARTLSEATNTYINLNALPARVKGVAVLPDQGEWIPFNCDAYDLKGLNTLWSHLNKPSSTAEKWQQLFSVDSSTLPSAEGKENANASMSVIEIDLTSPTSNRSVGEN
ncbi:kinetochore protein Spc25, partial [Drosophila hydei]|uniref:Kinetochore protein Spc25 n=1 Tax=Drosophila hydei TaxID=7224 RepID=A0A6J1L9Y1_DROHY